MFKKTLFMLLTLFMACGISAAQDEGEGAKEKKKEKAPTYSVMEISKSDKDVTFLVLEDMKAAEKKKELEKAYEDALKSWEKGKSEAEKGKEEYTVPKPVRPRLKVLQQGLSKEKAEELKAKSERASKGKSDIKKAPVKSPEKRKPKK